MARKRYAAQVDLLVRAIPIVADEPEFALKGGTAINLLHDGVPDFDLIGLPDAAQLPAIRWKVMNIERLKNRNKEKHAEQRSALEAALAAG